MSLPKISFEFFPPKSLSASFQLWDTMSDLAELSPEFVSITCGTGGGARSLTEESAITMSRRFGQDVAAHLTCANASKADIDHAADRYANSGVQKIVALRGDAIGSEAGFRPHPDGYLNSVQLVEALAKRGSFDIYVAAYPEPHPDSASEKQNIDWLKRKIDAGATAAITQYFFEAETFLRFRDACADAGITAPIIPGILPVHDWRAVQNFSANCGATIPERVSQGFERALRDDRTELMALSQASTLCTRLIEEGVKDLHFYTLNRSHLSLQICKALGIARGSDLAKVA